MGGSPNQVQIRTDKDLQCLTYTSEPLEQDTEVTGHPIVRLWVSSTADYGDFFVYLEDVDETGEAYYVTEGQLRAGFAGLVPNEDILPPDAGIDVLPDLPWHGYKEADYVDGILADGNIVELVFDLHPTSWVFKEGHRIRVSIASADWPTFKLHEQLAPTNDPYDPNNIVPTITVYRDAEHPSSIQLPVIPPKPRVFEGYAKIKGYKGPAELYTLDKAVYLYFDGQWINWDIIWYVQIRHIEFYWCEKKFRVFVWKETYAYAKGPGVHFFGKAV